MIKKLFFVASLTGLGHVATLVTIRILSEKLPNTVFAYLGELDALIIFLTSIIAFGLQLSTTRELALLDDDWKGELYDTQQARLTFSLFLLLLSITGFYYSKNILFLLSPLIALNADYALYGRGKPITGAFFAFLRLSIPALFLIIGSLFFLESIIPIYFISLVLSYLLTGVLISRNLDVAYFVVPDIKSLKKYFNNFGLGIASVAFIFLGVGLVNIVSYFYNNDTIAIVYVGLKLYVIFKGVRRIIVQSFFKDLRDELIALKVDFIAIVAGLSFLLCLSLYADLILPFLVDKQYLVYPELFMVLGLTGFLSSFTTSAGTRLLLKKQDNNYIRNIIIASWITIASTIVVFYLFGNKPHFIIISILLGELYLSVANVISLRENTFIKDRILKSLPIMLFAGSLFLIDYFLISNYFIFLVVLLLVIYYLKERL